MMIEIQASPILYDFHEEPVFNLSQHIPLQLNFSAYLFKIFYTLRILEKILSVTSTLNQCVHREKILAQILNTIPYPDQTTINY